MADMVWAYPTSQFLWAHASISAWTIMSELDKGLNKFGTIYGSPWSKPVASWSSIAQGEPVRQKASVCKNASTISWLTHLGRPFTGKKPSEHGAQLFWIDITSFVHLCDRHFPRRWSLDGKWQKAPRKRRDGKIHKENLGKNLLYKRHELLIDHLTLHTAYCT